MFIIENYIFGSSLLKDYLCFFFVLLLIHGYNSKVAPAASILINRFAIHTEKNVPRTLFISSYSILSFQSIEVLERTIFNVPFQLVFLEAGSG